MYIHSVKLINFKSIGDYIESEIILEPNITAIIGKNESGKSNILDGLSRINFLKNNPSAFSTDIINRNSETGTENKYLITLKFDGKESVEGVYSDTLVEITKTQCIVTGGLFEYYLEKVYPKFEKVVKVLDDINTNPMQLKEQDLNNYKINIAEFIQTEKLDLYRKKNALVFLVPGFQLFQQIIDKCLKIS